MTGDRPRAIVLSAFVMHPAMTSEPGVGWRFLLATARVAGGRGMVVVAVTNRRSYDACVSALPPELASVIRLRVVDLPHDFAFFRWHHPRFTRLEHEWWVSQARRHIRQIAADYDIAYAHHVTFASDLLGTPITSLSDRTLRVWGPVGVGGVAGAFLVRPRRPELWVHAGAQAARSVLARRISPRVTRRCDLVLAQSETFARMVRGRGVDVTVFPNVVVDKTPASQRARRDLRPRGLRLLFVGHVIARKRPDLAVAVLTDPRLAEAQLTVVGNAETPFHGRVSALAVSLGVSSRVTVIGPTDSAGVRRAMVDSDVLIHLSAREGAPAVVAEAATVALPVVCFEGTGGASVLQYCGGPGVAITPTTATSVAQLADAVLAAADMHRDPASPATPARLEALAEELVARAAVREVRS